MLLNVHTDDLSLIIHDCPDHDGSDKVEVCLTISVYGCSVQIKYFESDKLIRAKPNNTEKTVTAFYHFLQNDIDITGMQTIRSVLGFSPYYRNIGGRNVYAKDLDFGNIKELNARQKPVKYIALYGVQVPKAYIKLMKTITDLNEMNTLIGDALEEPPIPYDPDYVIAALKKLANPKVDVFNGNDAMVYDFLGCLEIFTMGTVFIYGDELLKDTLNNRALSGTWYIDDAGLRNFTLELSTISEYVPDAVIEVTSEYLELYERFKLKTDSIALRMIKLLLKNSGS
jgi:hypothetical protein